MKGRHIELFEKIKFIFLRKRQRIKKKIRKELYTDEQQKIFREVKLGEVIYAEMPFGDSKLFDIPDGHRARPYVVVKKNEKSLTCYPASHKDPGYKDYWRVFKLHKSRNDSCFRSGRESQNIYDSYFDLYQPSDITIDRINYFFMKPAPGEAERLERHLAVLRNRGKDVDLMGLKLIVREGDLLKLKNGPVFVYSHYKSEIYAHPAFRKENIVEGVDYIEVRFATRSYYVDYNKQLKIELEKKQYLYDSISQSVFAVFEKDKKKKKEYLKANKKIADMKEMNRKKLVKLKYRVGQIFKDEISEELFVYLYDMNNRFYGISYKDLETGKYQIRRMADINRYRKDKMLSEEALENLIVNLIPIDSAGVLPKVAEIAGVKLKNG